MRINVLGVRAHNAHTVEASSERVAAIFPRGEWWEVAVLAQADAIRLEAWPTAAFGSVGAELLYMAMPVQTPAMTRPQLSNAADLPPDDRRVFGSPALPLVRDYTAEFGVAGLKVLHWDDSNGRWRVTVEDPSGLLVSITYTIE